VHAGMRQRQRSCVYNALIVQDDIKIEQTRSVAHRLEPLSNVPLNILEHGEQLKRIQPGFSLYGQIDEPVLIQKINGVVEQILKGCGYQLTTVSDSHLCCGSAGTYSILQPDISGSLQQEKIRHLLAGKPELIVTANIGCQVHLQEASDVPVIHWIHLLDQNL